MKNEQKPKISTGLAVHTKLVAGDDVEPPAYNLGDRSIDSEANIMNYFIKSVENVNELGLKYDPEDPIDRNARELFERGIVWKDDSIDLINSEMVKFLKTRNPSHISPLDSLPIYSEGEP
jgi:capsid portal protein